MRAVHVVAEVVHCRFASGVVGTRRRCQRPVRWTRRPRCWLPGMRPGCSLLRESSMSHGVAIDHSPEDRVRRSIQARLHSERDER